MSDPAKRHEKQEKAVPNTARSNSEALKKLYADMLLIRRFEERAGQLYGMGLIGGFCHLYIGQEAVVVGMQAAARPDDQVITAYRDHGHMLAAGMDPKGVMAELTGRSTGYSKGKGGSMHMFSQPRRNSMAATASSARRCRWARAWPSPTNIAATTACASPISATARPTRARSMKASTWPSCGSCRWSTSSRTTNTPWAPAWRAPAR